MSNHGIVADCEGRADWEFVEWLLVEGVDSVTIDDGPRTTPRS